MNMYLVSGCGFKLCRQVAAIPFANAAGGGSLRFWLRFQAEALPRLQSCTAAQLQPNVKVKRGIVLTFHSSLESSGMAAVNRVSVTSRRADIQELIKQVLIRV